MAGRCVFDFTLTADHVKITPKGRCRMITDTENSDMPDRMTIWTTIGGYGAALIIMILMFSLSETIGS